MSIIRNRKAMVMLCIGACAVGGVQAEEFAFVGARALGMGGANAASTGDASAQWHNPAAFGFMGRGEWKTNAVDNGNLSAQGFSSELFGIGGGFTMTENMGPYLDILADIDFSQFGSGKLSSAENNIDSLLTMTAVIGSLDSGDALYADFSAGTSVQIGHFGIGVRMFGEVGAWALADRDNLSLDFSHVSNLVSEIKIAANNAGFVPGDGSYTLTQGQKDSLADALGNIDSRDEAIEYLDSRFQALADSGKLDGDEIAKAIELFKNLEPNASGVIGSNLTSVVGRGFTLVEVPVSYGWALNENLSFGITAKAMYGSVLGTQLWVFNEDNDKILEKVSDNVESTLTFGLDLGVLYRIPKFQFALVGHNLNRPTFSGFSNTVSLNGTPVEISVPEVKIDPQVTCGVAFMPSPRFTLETNLDLMETGTLLDDYDIQRLSFGGEFNMRLLALRLGAYKNLAESWQDWVATAGIGLDLFGARLDIGGAYSLGQSVEYNGASIPPEARLYASLGLDF